MCAYVCLLTYLYTHKYTHCLTPMSGTEMPQVDLTQTAINIKCNPCAQPQMISHENLVAKE